MKDMTVMVVDDDKAINDSIEIYLRSEGYKVVKAFDGEQAIRQLSLHAIDLILLDCMMPKMNGIQAMMEIRQTSQVPIIFLTAKSEDVDKVLGLNLGADDYITKPFHPMELLARVRSLLRRSKQYMSTPEQTSHQIVVDGLLLDMQSKSVTVEGEEIRLTPIEYGILELLMRNLNHVFSIDAIYEAVWKEPNINGENTVAVHIRRIREKIEINAKEPRYLKVVWGIGYKIEKKG